MWSEGVRERPQGDCDVPTAVPGALTGGELVYFDMDPSGQLNEYTERKDMSADVVCMALGNVPAREQRCGFLAVGLADNTVRIISLDPNDCLTLLSMQVSTIIC